MNLNMTPEEKAVNEAQLDLEYKLQQLNYQVTYEVVRRWNYAVFVHLESEADVVMLKLTHL